MFCSIMWSHLLKGYNNSTILWLDYAAISLRFIECTSTQSHLVFLGVSWHIPQVCLCSWDILSPSFLVFVCQDVLVVSTQPHPEQLAYNQIESSGICRESLSQPPGHV